MRGRTEITKSFVRAGFTLVRRRNHEIWACPCGHAQIVAATSGDGKGSAAVNLRTRIARTLRACQQQRSTAA